MSRKYLQGEYEVQNWDKYIGTKKPTYRSSYEREVMLFLDRAPSVIKWGAEMIIVPYYNEAKQREARYYVDIYVKYETRRGELREEIIEIKPYAQTQKPKRGRKSERTWLNENLTYLENMCKWTAAKKYAEERGWHFRILTENSIFR